MLLFLSFLFIIVGQAQHFYFSPFVSVCLWRSHLCVSFLKRNCVDVETGGLISKVLLANADALCAAVSPLMDVEEDPS